MKREEYPVRFTPRGLSDAWDATDAFHGACRSLSNLIFDPSNPEQVICRPGVGSAVTSFASFTTPTYIPIHVGVNGVIYGMVSSGKNAGKDEPFAFNTATGLFVTISGVTSGNTPTSLGTSGQWYPPTMAVIGSKIIVTHTGFSGSGANFFGVIDISTPASPTWTAANTATNALPSVPTAVANFNNRAYFACGNNAYYSDPLVPTTMTNAGQALTVGDPSTILGFSGLPVQTTSGGVVSALIVFKGLQIWQITGDAAVSGSLAQNFLSLTVGCVAPRTIVQTPVGTIFLGIDGMYMVSPLGQVLPLTNSQQSLTQDLQQPFLNATDPSRACASFSGKIYRICLKTIVDGIAVTSDYWFDIKVRRWNGPHTFPYDCASQVGTYFILSGSTNGAALYASSVLASSASVYNDNGSALNISMTPCLLPKTQNINQKQVIESTIELQAQQASLTYTINAYDESRSLLDSTNVTIFNPYSAWGSGFLWGSGILWQAGLQTPQTVQVQWNNPLVFKKISMQVTAQSSNALVIGTMFLKYQDLGYTNVLSSIN